MRAQVSLSMIVIVTILYAPIGASAQTPTMPDGTPAICNFALTVFASPVLEGTFKTCGGFEFETFGAAFNGSKGFIQIKRLDKDQTFKYSFSTMSVSNPGKTVPLLLLDSEKMPLPIIVILRPEKIDIAVGLRPFTGHYSADPNSPLLPRLAPQ